jgi:hypothetical protein
MNMKKTFFRIEVKHNKERHANLCVNVYDTLSKAKDAIRLERCYSGLDIPVDPIYIIRKVRLGSFGYEETIQEWILDWDLKPYKRFCIMPYRGDNMYKREHAVILYSDRVKAEKIADDMGYVVRELWH